jgi:general secretion pathway protein E
VEAPISLADCQACDRFLNRFSIEYCRHHSIVVTIMPDRNKPIAWVEDLDCQCTIDNVGRALGQPLLARVATAEEIRAAINRFYEQQAANADRSLDAPSLQEALAGDQDPVTKSDLLESDSRGPVVQLVNQLLLEAIQQGASDVHLQPYEDQVTVRMRVDGVLTPVRTIPKAIQEEVVSRLKVAGQMDIAEKRLPQDGRATVCVGERVIDLRLASMPTSFGERVVVRLLDKSARLYRLREIGMDEETLRRFREVIHIEHGLVLVTGPTGSGKSTTLYAALQELDTRQKNAVTLEDPIEYQLDGISQTQINTKKGMTFASGLRSVLRQDPDIIMLGEIRDRETAVMAIQSALTGHMVFSTLHTNDAASTVTRLLDLGIEPYLVASSVLAVMAQRLVRRSCSVCHGEAATAGVVADPMKQTFRCKACRDTGYRGREGIYELLIVDDAIRELIQSRSHATKIRDMGVARGMKLLRESGLEKVRAGITTTEEIERVTMRAAM